MTVSELFKRFVNVVKLEPESHRVDVLAAELVSALALMPERRALASIVHYERIDDLEETALALLEVMFSVKATVKAINPQNWTYRQVILSLEDAPVPFVGAVVTERVVGMAA